MPSLPRHTECAYYKIASLFYFFAEQTRKALAAHLNRFAADLNFEQIVQRLIVDDPNLGAGNQPELLPTAKTGGVVILSFPNDDRLAGPKVLERLELATIELSLARGNGMAVGIVQGLTQMRRQGLLQSR